MSRYDDIIGLPRFVSRTRKHMSNSDRAAQFAPFAALTGFGEKITEAARLTEGQIELSESEKAMLDYKFSIIAANLDRNDVISISYFVPDELKSGGAYRTATIRLKRIDLLRRVLIDSEGRNYDIDYIADVSSDLFGGYGI